MTEQFRRDVEALLSGGLPDALLPTIEAALAGTIKPEDAHVRVRVRVAQHESKLLNWILEHKSTLTPRLLTWALQVVHKRFEELCQYIEDMVLQVITGLADYSAEKVKNLLKSGCHVCLCYFRQILPHPTIEQLPPKELNQLVHLWTESVGLEHHMANVLRAQLKGFTVEEVKASLSAPDSDSDSSSDDDDYDPDERYRHSLQMVKDGHKELDELEKYWAGADDKFFNSLKKA